MKLKLITVGILLGSACVSFAMETVKMPKAEILKKRLCKIGMDHFIEKTNIVDQLADKEKAPLGVAMSIEQAFADYCDYLGGPQNPACITSQMSKPMIYRALLEDYPDALAELEKNGLYKPFSKK